MELGVRANGWVGEVMRSGWIAIGLVEGKKGGGEGLWEGLWDGSRVGEKVMAR